MRAFEECIEPVLQRHKWTQLSETRYCAPCGLGFVEESQNGLWAFEPAGGLTDVQKLEAALQWADVLRTAATEFTVYVDQAYEEALCAKWTEQDARDAFEEAPSDRGYRILRKKIREAAT